MKCKFHLILFAFLFALSSCNIEKRVYQSGYYISGKHNTSHEIQAIKNIKYFDNSEKSISKRPDEIPCDTTKEISIPTPSNSIPPANEINKSKITQVVSEEIKASSDSIPEEGKLLLAKYEKTHKAKDKIAKIAYYPIALLALCWFTALLLFVPIVYGLISYDGDPNIKRFFIVCLSAIAFTIPLLIAYMILSIITKKQRRKLRKMGLIK
jgi:phage shock protein PspC (stress-responsive transcriptional regulator)